MGEAISTAEIATPAALRWRPARDDRFGRDDFLNNDRRKNAVLGSVSETVKSEKLKVKSQERKNAKQGEDWEEHARSARSTETE